MAEVNARAIIAMRFIIYGDEGCLFDDGFDGAPDLVNYIRGGDTVCAVDLSGKFAGKAVDVGRSASGKFGSHSARHK